jgi:hypothetical protein
VLCDLLTDWGTSDWSTNRNWNAVVPINVYNVREGRINTSLASGSVYERGITNVIEINMRNLARWVDGVYDNNLLQGTGAVSANIACPDGYTVYVSDRRGDDIKSMTVAGNTFNATNGMVDNEDIYGPNGTLDPGEDVQQTGSLVKDTNELPDPAVLGAVSPGYGTDINKRAITVSDWINLDSTGINHKMFRNSVRLFNGENLQISGNTGKLSTTKGITISSENMVYIWGNYNTTGIDVAPADGVSCLNDNTGSCHYLGNQVPTSIVCDAVFPLSKTFFDSETSLYPDDFSKRAADRSPTVAQETSVRAAILAGNNLSALAGSPDAGNSASGESRLCGGMHNFPRFLEDWSARWNFVGSLIPLYRSTQAVGQYNADSSIYGPPTRDWAFDITVHEPSSTSAWYTILPAPRAYRIQTGALSPNALSAVIRLAAITPRWLRFPSPKPARFFCEMVLVVGSNRGICVRVGVGVGPTSGVSSVFPEASVNGIRTTVQGVRGALLIESEPIPFEPAGFGSSHQLFFDDFFFEDFFFGTLPPSLRASDNPIAIACFLLVTFLPDPLFRVPSLRSCIAFLTFFCAFFPYLAISSPHFFHIW